MNLKCESETLFCQAENMYCAGCGYSYLRNKDTSPTKTVFFVKKRAQIFLFKPLRQPPEEDKYSGAPGDPNSDTIDLGLLYFKFDNFRAQGTLHVCLRMYLFHLFCVIESISNSESVVGLSMHWFITNIKIQTLLVFRSNNMLQPRLYRESVGPLNFEYLILFEII